MHDSMQWFGLEGGGGGGGGVVVHLLGSRGLSKLQSTPLNK